MLELYNSVASRVTREFPDVEQRKFFGKPCLMVSGKAFAISFGGEMVFKLPKDKQWLTAKLKGSANWEPSGHGVMREWIQVPVTHSGQWYKLAVKAMECVKQEADAGS